MAQKIKVKFAKNNTILEGANIDEIAIQISKLNNDAVYDSQVITVVLIYKIIALGPFSASASTLVMPFWFVIGDVIADHDKPTPFFIL